MMIPSISKRAQYVGPSPMKKFESLIHAVEKRGVKIFKLHIGDSDLPFPGTFFKTIAAYRKKTLGYTPSSGLAEHVRAWIVYYKHFGITLKPEHIVPTVGGSEAILFALMAVADAGDEVLICEPSYANYKGFAMIANITLVPMTLREETKYALPPEKEIIKKISKKTKAIVIVNPDNPTGKVWTDKECTIIARIAKKYNLFIIADETYREIVFNKKPKTFLKYASTRNRVIVIDSASKRFCVPGARIGCITSFNTDITKVVFKFATLRNSVPTLEQIGTIPLLMHHAKYTKYIVQEYQKRCATVVTELKKIPDVHCFVPNGAFYVTARLPIHDTEHFIYFLLKTFRYQNKTIVFSPLKDFYLSKNKGVDMIRIACVLNQKDLKKSMQILGYALKSYTKHKT